MIIYLLLSNILLFYWPTYIAANSIESLKLRQQIRNAFNQRTLSVDRILENELLCECNGAGCDKEIIDVIGNGYNGVCRARKGGVCRKVIEYDDAGNMRDVSLACVTEAELLPPERPFICQDVKTSRFMQKIDCCSNVSFCNHFEKMQIPVVSDEKSLLFYFALLLIVAFIFSAAGLFVGIFTVHGKGGKRLFFELFRDSPREMASKYLKDMYVDDDMEKETNQQQLVNLLEDLDTTIGSTGSGSGVPSLAERTIARQVTLHHSIGRGGFGEVFLGDWKGEFVAAKIFLAREEASWRRETSIYRSNMLRHSNVLRWIASDNRDAGTSTEFWLVTEYCSYGSLYDYLGNFELDQVLGVQFIRDIVNGVAYLHGEVPGVNPNADSIKPAIAHRDLKSCNILVKENLSCVIADFGLAVCSHKGKINFSESNRSGTPRYLPPESFHKTYSCNCFSSYARMDIYALGLVIWEICRRMKSDISNVPSHLRELPFFEYVSRDPKLPEVYACVHLHRHRPSISSSWQNSLVMRELLRIMRECWSEDPNSRLPALNARFSLDKLICTQNMNIPIH